VEASADLVVQYREEGQPILTLSQGVDYTLSQSVPPNDVSQFPEGGTVNFITIPPDQSTVSIYRRTPADQETAYNDFGDFPAKSHEAALDRAAMRDDEQNAILTGVIDTPGDFVTSFNGRDGDVVPVSGDYRADQIPETAGRIWFTPTERNRLNTLNGHDLEYHPDVDFSGLANGQFFMRRNGEWTNDKPEITSGLYRVYNGLGDGDKIRASSTITDGSITGLLNISPNDAAGFQAVAQAPCWLDIGFSVRCTCPLDGGDFKIAIGKNTGDTFPGPVLSQDSSNQPTQLREFSASTFATVSMSDGDAVYLYFADIFRTNDIQNVFITTLVRER